MNKIKIIYDVVRKMKDKDLIKGTLKAEGLKDDVKILNVNNTFEKNTKDGQTKGKINMEIDCDGKKMKMENNIDFQGEGCHGHQHFMKHLHSFHHQHGEHVGGLKEGFSRIATVLGVLSSIELDEKEDGLVVLSLDSANIPEDIKNGIHEKMKQVHEHHEHMDWANYDHMYIKEFHSMENANFTLNVYISANREIEKVAIKANSVQKDEKAERHDMKLMAELSLE